MTAMSCVRPPEMTRLEEVKSDDEESVSSALCCGFLGRCFTLQVFPQAPEEQTVAVDQHRRSMEQSPTFLEGIRASLSVPINLRRKSHVKPKELICCLLEPESEKDPCPVCPILLCPACDTLHCHPNYIYHCLLEHPISPGLDKGAERALRTRTRRPPLSVAPHLHPE